MSDTQGFLSWLIPLLATSGIALILGLINLFKSGASVKKEIRSIELENRKRELDISAKVDELSSRNAEKALKTQETLDLVQARLLVLCDEHEKLKKEYEVLKADNQKLVEIVENQKQEIDILVCELNNHKAYINALIEQMKKENITPIKMQNLSLPDYDNIKPKKQVKSKGKKYGN